jgi:hypothetical protein
VAEVLDEILMAAATASCSHGSSFQRLSATLSTLSRLHQDRMANDIRLHELVVAAVQADYPVILAYTEMIRGVVETIIVAGQGSGEIRSGSPMALTCCLLDAMEAYVGPSPAKSFAARPTFADMMEFCACALRNAMRLQPIGALRNSAPVAIYQS